MEIAPFQTQSLSLSESYKLMKQFLKNNGIKSFAKKILLIALPVVFLLSLAKFAHAQIITEPDSEPKPEKVVVTPDLADIIPLGSNLPGRLTELKNKMVGLQEIQAIEISFSEYQERVEKLENQLAKIQDAEGENLFKLINLSRILKDENTYFEFINRPLGREIRKVAAWRTEWVEEKNRWDNWESRLHIDRESEVLKSAFAKAHTIIDTAIHITQVQLETMLQYQAQGAEFKARIDTLEVKTLALISASYADSLLAASPKMFSPDYFAQFRRDLFFKIVTSLRIIIVPDSRFVLKYGWFLITQIFLIFAVIFTIYRNRQPLFDSEHWRFLAERPVASGLFVGLLIFLLFPKYQFFPISLRLVNLVAGGISSCLLLKSLLGKSWKRQFAYGVIVLYVLMYAMIAINLPQPLFRLYTFVASVLALYFLRRWARESIKKKDSLFYTWLLRLGAILAVVIAVAQFWGMDKIASYLFEATFSSLAITLAFILFMYIIQGFLYWVFYASPFWNIKQLRSEAKTLKKRVGLIINTSIVLLVMLPMIFSAWGLFGSVQKAVAGLLALGFDIGSQRISVGLVIAAVGTLYVSVIFSRVLPKVLLDEKVAGAGLERGVKVSVMYLIQYFIVFIGFLITIMVIGLDLTKLTIILSAFGVGIGFGLQGIVNNFISGLMLLFEQPVRIGDTIEMDGVWAEIERIGLRSTTVRTLDDAEMIIPNANLVSNEVTNWTLSNRRARVIITVGVAYGSDIPLVIETLLACTADNKLIAKSPEPQVLFRSFGESSLNFELRIWIKEVDDRLVVSSELHQEIDRRFRQANIEIAFPQRDLHLRSSDSQVIVQHSDVD